MNDIDFSAFERLHGERPYLLLDRHPDGRHIAAQVVAFFDVAAERAAVWDRETGKVVWAPEGVSAIAWMPGGERVAFVYEEYKHAPDHPAIIVTPLQREFTYAFMLATWPDRHFIDSCALTFPMGWPTDLVVSPRGDLAVVQWRDQCESGLEFVAITAEGPRQIEQTGLPRLAPLVNGMGDDGGGFPLNTDLTSRPAFSPDGRYIVLPWQDEWVWWTSNDADVDDERNKDKETAVSPGGEYTIGAVSILDWQERTHRAIPIVERIPAGWRPDPRADGGEGLIIDPPTFTDDRRFTLTLPTGATRTFSVTD